jgi:lysozyme family protein
MSPNQKKIVIVGLVGLLVVAAVTSNATTVTENNVNEFDMFKWQIDYIIDKWEGVKCENVSGDRGGVTKFGITKKEYPNLDICNLTREQAIKIYFDDYWTRGKLKFIPDDIQFMHFGGVVNFGIGGQTKCLQRAAGVSQDGIVGVATLSAAQNVTPQSLFNAQKQRYDDIIAAAHAKNDYSQDRFYRGWMNRIEDFFRQQLEVNQYG